MCMVILNQLLDYKVQTKIYIVEYIKKHGVILSPKIATFATLAHEVTYFLIGLKLVLDRLH